MNSGKPGNAGGLGCGGLILIIIIVVLLFSMMGGSSDSSSSKRTTTTRQTQSNPIRDRDPEYYDYLERQYNDMIKNHK